MKKILFVSGICFVVLILVLGFVKHYVNLNPKPLTKETVNRECKEKLERMPDVKLIRCVRKMPDGTTYEVELRR